MQREVFVLLALISYICVMNPDNEIHRSLRIIYKSPEFEEFYADLPDKVRTKFDYVMLVVQTIYDIPAKFVRHLEKTDLYEMRVSVGTNEYRTILFAIDHTNVIESTKIILLSGFLKKSTKDYTRQVEKAINILKLLQNDEN